MDVEARLAPVSAVLVEERILRRLIKRHCRIHGVGLQVPHAECYVLPRADLARLVDAHELRVPLGGLPERVIAISGSRDGLAAGTPEATTRAWRAIFHGRVHEAFDDRLARGQLTRAAIRERIGRIGQTEFDEIRYVLRQADRLLPPVSEASTYVEFAALYLELRHFAPDALAKTFPTLEDTGHVDAVLALDVDADALLAAARPLGAPARPATARADDHAAAVHPVPSGPTEPAAIARAQLARARGNHARAAILAMRGGDRDAARADLDALAARLATALEITHGLPDGPYRDRSDLRWGAALEPVVARIAYGAAAGKAVRFSAGARMLHDLQTACTIAEREARVVDLVGWALSLGKQPVVRALPATREVRIAKRLHSATKKLAGCGLTPAEREELADTLHGMTQRAEDNLRRTFRPKLEAALSEVGLEPSNLPERVAQKKLVDELLDQAVAVGRLSLGNLRDALSHNDLKLRDLRASQLVYGDQLLRCDRALARSLDGVYRRGEVYLRFLQKLSSVLFGTGLGRLLSLYALLPVLGAFVAVEGAQHIVGPISEHVFGVEPEPELATTGAFVGVGVFLFLTLHVPAFRRALMIVLRGFLRAIKLVLYDAPRAVWRLDAFARLRDGRLWQLLIKPAMPASLVLAFTRDPTGWIIAGSVFVTVELVVSSRLGRRIEETLVDWLLRSGRQLARHIAPGLVLYILRLFAKLMELLDRGIYRIDEYLRFKSGQSRVTLVIKAVLAPLWHLVSYFLRLYINLFVEPVVNPIKHFPVVTVAAKLTLPFSPSMIHAIKEPLRPIVGRALAGSAAGFTVFVIPGLAGFLVWELKENWKLYAATRRPLVGPVAIGHHGESMVRLMKPGLHSGTVPKLYGKLRRAAWRGDERGVAKHREGLHHVEEAIYRFADRELVSLLARTEAFADAGLAVAEIGIASNRVMIELACPAISAHPARLAFEEQSGWLLASFRHPGWIAQLDPARRRVLENALVGFYKRAGVDLVREQLVAALGDVPYDVSREGLVTWPGQGYTTEAIYDLHSRDLRLIVRGEPPAVPPPALSEQRAMFGREALAWTTWTTAWAPDREPPRIAAGPPLLPS